MELLKEHEEYIDRVAIEISNKYFEKSLPTSDADRIIVATASYKQAVAMLEVKLGLEAIIGKTPYLVKYRVESNKKKKELNLH